MFHFGHIRYVISCRLFWKNIQLNRLKISTLISIISLQQYLYFKQAFMATLYLTIFGMIISVIDSIIYFTSMWQKDKLFILHVLFFIPFFVCGLVSIIGSSAHKDSLSTIVGSGTLICYIACCGSTCQF